MPACAFSYSMSFSFYDIAEDIIHTAPSFSASGMAVSTSFEKSLSALSTSPLGMVAGLSSVSSVFRSELVQSNKKEAESRRERKGEQDTWMTRRSYLILCRNRDIEELRVDCSALAECAIPHPY